MPTLTNDGVALRVSSPVFGIPIGRGSAHCAQLPWNAPRLVFPRGGLHAFIHAKYKRASHVAFTVEVAVWPVHSEGQHSMEYERVE